MTLVEHLTELRRRLIISAIALAIGAGIAFLLYNPILSFLSGPYHAISHGHNKLIVTDQRLEGGRGLLVPRLGIRPRVLGPSEPDEPCDDRYHGDNRGDGLCHFFSRRPTRIDPS